MRRHPDLLRWIPNVTVNTLPNKRQLYRELARAEDRRQSSEYEGAQTDRQTASRSQKDQEPRSSGTLEALPLLVPHSWPWEVECVELLLSWAQTVPIYLGSQAPFGRLLPPQ